MRNFAFGVVAALLLIPAAPIVFFALGCTDVRSDVKPSRWESHIMNFAVRKAVRRSASRISSPGAAGDEILVTGGKLYVQGCTGCHGELTKPFHEDGANFPPVPQLPHAETQYSEPELYWIVKHGIRMTGMSAYGPFYSEQQLWALAAFLHRIKNLPVNVLNAIQMSKQ